VLVTAREWSCQHEWYMHEKLARKAGLDPRIFEAIARGEEPRGMSPDEALVYGASRQAHRTGRLDDATFAAARARFGLDGTLELLALNGYYSMMAMVLNTAGMPLPDGAAPPLPV
jgi:4-carboxymuconolactone decarboxylase